MAWNWHFHPRGRHWTEQTLPLYCQRCRSRSDPYFHFHLFTHGGFLRALLFLLFGWRWGWRCQLRGLVQCLIILFLKSFLSKRKTKCTHAQLHTSLTQTEFGHECKLWNVQCDHLRAVHHYCCCFLSLPFRLSLLPPSLLPPAMLLSSSHREKGSGRERERAVVLM